MGSEFLQCTSGRQGVSGGDPGTRKVKQWEDDQLCEGADGHRVSRIEGRATWRVVGWVSRGAVAISGAAFFGGMFVQRGKRESFATRESGRRHLSGKLDEA